MLAATTDEQILQTWDVMLQLRPGVAADAYLVTVQRIAISAFGENPTIAKIRQL